MTRITIAIPAYNSERCLRETLESALNQTQPADEVLVIDDGSTDGTAEIAHSFGDRVRYIKQANQGIAGARNRAIQEATGDWIAFLDHDDLVLPTKLEKQSAVIESNPNLIAVYSAFSYMYEDGSTQLVPAFPAKDLWPALRYRTPILPSASIIRRTALQEVGGFVHLYCIDDWNLWFRLVRHFSPRAFQELPESLTLYRWWDNNLSKNYMPMAKAVMGMTDDLLLADLTGLKKTIWQRRVYAKIFYGLSVNLREARDERYWEFAIESFLQWPFPGRINPPHRYKVFAHMLWTKLRSISFSRRYWWPDRRCREDLSL